MIPGIPDSVLDHFKRGELVSAIAQDAATKDVLMQAWMNQEALELTLKTGRATYWSRSRQQIWVKGETSGHTQKVVDAWFDCDGDSILLVVEQVGAACHTGERTCYHSNLQSQSFSAQAEKNQDS